jgi:hypothetical protein
VSVASKSTVQPQYLALALATITSVTFSAAYAKDHCDATPISMREATVLLDLTPRFIEARRLGQIPAPVAWEPTAEHYHNNTFFYFDVRMANSDSADGGLIGYFAVSKITARVFDITLDSSPVSGVELRTSTRSLRKRHCITQQFLLQYKDEDPVG